MNVNNKNAYQHCVAPFGFACRSNVVVICGGNCHSNVVVTVVLMW